MFHARRLQKILSHQPVLKPPLELSLSGQIHPFPIKIRLVRTRIIIHSLINKNPNSRQQKHIMVSWMTSLSKETSRQKVSLLTDKFSTSLSSTKIPFLLNRNETRKNQNQNDKQHDRQFIVKIQGKDYTRGIQIRQFPRAGE